MGRVVDDDALIGQHRNITYESIAHIYPNQIDTSGQRCYGFDLVIVHDHGVELHTAR